MAVLAALTVAAFAAIRSRYGHCEMFGLPDRKSILNFQTCVHALRSSNFRIYDTFITISNYQKMV